MVGLDVGEAVRADGYLQLVEFGFVGGLDG